MRVDARVLDRLPVDLGQPRQRGDRPSMLTAHEPTSTEPATGGPTIDTPAPHFDSQDTSSDETAAIRHFAMAFHTIRPRAQCEQGKCALHPRADRAKATMVLKSLKPVGQLFAHLPIPGLRSVETSPPDGEVDWTVST